MGLVYRLIDHNCIFQLGLTELGTPIFARDEKGIGKEDTALVWSGHQPEVVAGAIPHHDKYPYPAKKKSPNVFLLVFQFHFT